MKEAQRLWGAAQRRLEAVRTEDDDAVRHAATYREQRRTFGQWDNMLDACVGECCFTEPEIAQLLTNTLEYWNGKTYDLLADVIMPNHVHLLLTPRSKTPSGYYSLSEIMHSFKGYTATMANRMLKRTGRLWQHESYDHWVRDAGEMDRIIFYILNNPVKADLVARWEDWPWSYTKWPPS